MVFAIVLGLVLVCLYLVSIRPNPGRGERMRPFEEVLIAHRGLHENPAVPENSRTAFAKAAEAGYGIELDVQLTADDQLVVFHDETLQRVCGDPRKLHELTYAELGDMRLLGTEEKIPLFRDVLALIGGRVPLLVEIKSEGRYTETTRLACEMLKTYDGIYIVESFHPMVLRQIRKEHPDVIRGQLSTHYTREKVERPGYQRFLLTNLMVLPIASFLVPCGLISLSLGGSTIGVLFSKVTWGLAWLMNHSVGWIESLPGSTVPAHINGWMIAIYYILLILFYVFVFKKDN